MNNIFQKILSYFFAFKYKDKTNVLSAKIGSKKVCITKNESLEIQTEYNKQKAEFEKELSEIFLKHLGDTEGLFEFLKENGAQIYRIAKSDLILEFLSQSEGYVSPKKGFKALILNFFLNRKLSVQTPHMFIFKTEEISVVTLYYEIYKWFWNLKNATISEKINLNNISDDFISKLSYKDTVQMKQLVEDDIGAINFVLQFIKNHQSTKDASEKMQTEGSVNI